MVVVSVVAVLAAFEERAELDRLVGFVVVHRLKIEPGDTQRQPGRECNHDEGARARTRHFGEPKTSTST